MTACVLGTWISSLGTWDCPIFWEVLGLMFSMWCEVVTSLATSLLVRVSKGWGGSIRKIYLLGLGVAPAGREQSDQGVWQQTDAQEGHMMNAWLGGVGLTLPCMFRWFTPASVLCVCPGFGSTDFAICPLAASDPDSRRTNRKGWDIEVQLFFLVAAIVWRNAVITLLLVLLLVLLSLPYWSPLHDQCPLNFPRSTSNFEDQTQTPDLWINDEFWMVATAVVMRNTTVWASVLGI